MAEVLSATTVSGSSTSTDPSPTSFSALIRLLRYARGYRRRILQASLCSALNTLFDVMPEILIGIAIDVVVNQQSSFVAALGFDTPHQQIVLLGVLTLLIWVGESLFQYLYLVLWRKLAQDLQADLRQDAYDQVQRQGMAFFESRSSGELTSILNDDVNQLERFLDGGANDFLQVFMAVFLVGTVFFIVSPTIALLAITPIPVVIWGAFYFMRRATPLYAEVREQVGSLANRLANNLGGMATIKAFTAEARESSRLRLASRAYVEANGQAIQVSSAFVPLIRMAILLGFLATFIVGGFMAIDGSLNVGLYGMLVFLTQRLLWPLTRLAQTVDLYERAMASTRRILGLIESRSDVRDTATGTLAHPVRGEVRFESVGFRYEGAMPSVSDMIRHPASESTDVTLHPTSDPADASMHDRVGANGGLVRPGAGLDNISLVIAAGSTVALVGATGSGKSTLIKLLLRFYPVGMGSISIDGQAIDSLSLKALREVIGLVSQDVFLFEGSVRDNIAYGDDTASVDAVREAASAAEAMDFIDALPRGLDTLVGERGVKLSGGQRQRISLARAILKDPPILILDEATSAVDNETEAAIQRSLSRLSRDRTVLVVAHRLSTIVAADRIVVMEKGKIVESGTHQDLLSLDGHYARQWRVQTGVQAA